MIYAQRKIVTAFVDDTSSLAFERALFLMYNKYNPKNIMLNITTA